MYSLDNLRNSYNDKGLNMDVIGELDVMEFIPIYHYIGGSVNYYHPSQELISIPNIMKSYSVYSQDSSINLKTIEYLTQIKNGFGTLGFKNQEHTFRLNFGLGFILDQEDNILLLLTHIKKRNRINPASGKLIGGNHRLYISHELNTNPKYASIMRNLNKNYIDGIAAQGCEILYCPSENIKEDVFINSYKIDIQSLEDLNSFNIDYVDELLNFTE